MKILSSCSLKTFFANTQYEAQVRMYLRPLISFLKHSIIFYTEITSNVCPNRQAFTVVRK